MGLETRARGCIWVKDSSTESSLLATSSPKGRAQFRAGVLLPASPRPPRTLWWDDTHWGSHGALCPCINARHPVTLSVCLLGYPRRALASSGQDPALNFTPWAWHYASHTGTSPAIKMLWSLSNSELGLAKTIGGMAIPTCSPRARDTPELLASASTRYPQRLIGSAGQGYVP